MSNEKIPNWDENSFYLRHEPMHEYGNGRYYKQIGSGNDEQGFFAFIPVVYDARFYEEPQEQENTGSYIRARCDSAAPKSMPMPTDVHEADEDGVCMICGSSEPIFGTTKSHVASLTNSRVLRFPFHGYKGFITYMELINPEIEKRAFVLPQNTARTLQELFKLMLEWDWAYTELECRDVHSVLAHEMLEELEMPEVVKSWVVENVPDMRVAKFFKGDTSARDRNPVELIPDMSLDFDAWCWHNVQRKPSLWKYGVK